MPVVCTCALYLLNYSVMLLLNLNVNGLNARGFLGRAEHELLEITTLDVFT